MSDSTKQSFIKGAAILGAAGLIGKVIGAVYRVLLFNVLQSTGMGYYEIAYPIYSFLLVISSAGLPTAISKLVSERVAIDDYRGAHRTFQTAYKLLALIGVATTVLLLIFARPYAGFVGSPAAVWALLAIAPSLFFVAVISAYRGYFQGLQMMSPTAGSQLVEQLGKFAIGFLLAKVFIGAGSQFGAMGALLGVSISEFLAMGLLIILYNRKKGEIKQNMKRYPSTLKDNRKSMMLKIIYVALPITVGASIMPLSSMLDTVIVMNRLGAAGFSADLARELYGVYTGSIMAIVNMPAVISLSLGMSLVPAVAASLAKKDWKATKKTANIGVKLSLLFGLPCIVGLYLCAEPVLTLLFKRSLTADEMTIAIRLLEVMSVAVLFLTIVQTMTSVIQGYGKYMVPVVSLGLGALAKVIVSFILVGNPNVNILGAAYGTLVCYAVAGLINMAVVFKLARLKFSIVDYIIRPVFSTVVMGLVVYFLLPLTIGIAGSNIGLLVTILFAVVVYLAVVLVSGALTRQDMEFIPGGRKITALLLRAHIWKEN